MRTLERIHSENKRKNKKDAQNMWSVFCKQKITLPDLNQLNYFSPTELTNIKYAFPLASRGLRLLLLS